MELIISLHSELWKKLINRIAIIVSLYGAHNIAPTELWEDLIDFEAIIVSLPRNSRNIS